MATLTISDGGGIVPNGPYFSKMHTQIQLPGEKESERRKKSEFLSLFTLVRYFGNLEDRHCPKAQLLHMDHLV